MAFVSAFGFGGTDHLNTFFENEVGNYYQNKLFRQTADYNAALQYQYAEKYAKNNPSWSVEGLRSANLNPILAATDGAFSSPTVPSVNGVAGTFSNDWRSEFNAEGLKNGIANRRLLKSQADLNSVEEDLAEAKMDTEAAQQEKLMADAEKARVEADNARHTKGINNKFNAGASILTHGYEFSKQLLNHTPPSGSSSSVDSHDVKSISVPSGFKPNWSDSTSVGKFFNDIDRSVYQDRIERKRQKDKSYLQGPRRGRGPKRK